MRRGQRGRLGKRWAAGVGALLVLAAGLAGAADDAWQAARARMVAEIRDDVRATRSYIGKGALDEAVMDALGRVPRHRFVPDDLQDVAYENRPLPIGFGQTISQPYIVALMTDLLAPSREGVFLEVGTGSGYQAAVLAALAGSVFTIEIIPQLAEAAAARLRALGFANVRVRTGDGYYGWEAAGPFDGIVVTAVAGHVPPPLLAQLKPGGRMVIPVGQPFGIQQLLLVRKGLDGELTTRQILPVRFVPLTGGPAP